MQIAIVASSVPARGSRPVVLQAPELKTVDVDGGYQLAMTFANEGFWQGARTLYFHRDVIAIAPVPEEIIKPYGVEAARQLGLESNLADYMSRIPLLGGIARLMAADAAAYQAEDSALAGCALVYKNQKDVPVVILLCGLVRSILRIFDAVPAERHSEDLPPPFTLQGLAKIAEKHLGEGTYDY